MRTKMLWKEKPAKKLRRKHKLTKPTEIETKKAKEISHNRDII